MSWIWSSTFTRLVSVFKKTGKITESSLQVYSIVDEMFLAGEIRETSQTKVLKQLLMLNSLE